MPSGRYLWSLRFQSIDSSAGRFTADQTHVLILYKMIKRPDGVRSPPTQAITASGSRLPYQQLFLDFPRNNRLEIADNGRGKDASMQDPENIMRIVNTEVHSRIVSETASFKVPVPLDTGCTFAPRRRIL